MTTKAAERKRARRVRDMAATVEDLVRVLGLPDLSAEERPDYEDALENAMARLEEARAA
jgi:hypothetical protein